MVRSLADLTFQPSEAPDDRVAALEMRCVAVRAETRRVAGAVEDEEEVHVSTASVALVGSARRGDALRERGNVP